MENVEILATVHLTPNNTVADDKTLMDLEESIRSGGRWNP